MIPGTLHAYRKPDGSLLTFGSLVKVYKSLARLKKIPGLQRVTLSTTGSGEPVVFVCAATKHSKSVYPEPVSFSKEFDFMAGGGFGSEILAYASQAKALIEVESSNRRLQQRYAEYRAKVVPYYFSSLIDTDSPMALPVVSQKGLVLLRLANYHADSSLAYGVDSQQQILALPLAEQDALFDHIEAGERTGDPAMQAMAVLSALEAGPVIGDATEGHQWRWREAKRIKHRKYETDLAAKRGYTIDWNTPGFAKTKRW